MTPSDVSDLKRVIPQIVPQLLDVYDRKHRISTNELGLLLFVNTKPPDVAPKDTSDDCQFVDVIPS